MFQIILEVSLLKPSQSIASLHYSVSDYCTQLGKTIKEVSSILPCHALSFTFKPQCKQSLCRHMNSFHFMWCLEEVKEFSFRVTGTPEMETRFCGLKTYKGCLDEVENAYHRKGQWKRKNTHTFIHSNFCFLHDRSWKELSYSHYQPFFFFWLIEALCLSNQ